MNKNINIIQTKCLHCPTTLFFFENSPQIPQFPCASCEPFLLINPISQEIAPKSLIIAKSLPPLLSAANYSENDLLHVGISNSSSFIYNFWGNYRVELQKDRVFWENTVNIPLNLGKSLENEAFDKALERSLVKQRENFAKYDQFSNNCYSFVCRFMEEICYEGIKCWGKEDLARVLIEPKLEALREFCEIYAKIEKNQGVFKENVREKKKITVYLCDFCEKRIREGEGKHCLVCKDFDLCKSCFVSQGHQHEPMRDF